MAPQLTLTLSSVVIWKMTAPLLVPSCAQPSCAEGCLPSSVCSPVAPKQGSCAKWLGPGGLACPRQPDCRLSLCWGSLRPSAAFLGFASECHLEACCHTRHSACCLETWMLAWCVPRELLAISSGMCCSEPCVWPQMVTLSPSFWAADDFCLYILYVNFYN